MYSKVGDMSHATFATYGDGVGVFVSTRGMGASGAGRGVLRFRAGIFRATAKSTPMGPWGKAFFAVLRVWGTGGEYTLRACAAIVAFMDGAIQPCDVPRRRRCVLLCVTQ